MNFNFIVISLLSLRVESSVVHSDEPLQVVWSNVFVSELSALADLCSSDGSSLLNESMASISTSSVAVDSIGLATSREVSLISNISHNIKEIQLCKEKKTRKKYLPIADPFGQFDCILSLLSEVVSVVSSSVVSKFGGRPTSWGPRLLVF